MARGDLASRITKKPADLASRITPKRPASLAHRITKRAVPQKRRNVQVIRRSRRSALPPARRIPVPKSRQRSPSLNAGLTRKVQHGLSAVEDAEGFRRLETDLSSIVVAIDGSCMHNGYPDARAGYGVFFSSSNASHHNVQGLVPEYSPQTSQYAELYAVMKALDVIHELIIGGHEISHVVFKTDSAYVEDGVCRFVFNWMRNGWRTVNGELVVNGRAFRYLHEKIGLLEMEYGVLVSFLRVPREYNTQADALARLPLLAL